MHTVLLHLCYFGENNWASILVKWQRLHLIISLITHDLTLQAQKDFINL